jgi:hypothetical protein
MTDKCCINCSKLDRYHRCTIIQEQMLVMVRVFDIDFEDISSKVNKDQTLIVKDRALKSFCCNQFTAKSEKEDIKNDCRN